MARNNNDGATRLNSSEIDSARPESKALRPVGRFGPATPQPSIKQEKP
jgi:hypothetical protein